MAYLTPVYDTECPVTVLMQALSKRWTFFILRAIRRDIRGFNAIRRELQGRISSRTLSDRLQELIVLGLIKREGEGYVFTKKGTSMHAVMDSTCSWAAKFEGLPRE